MDDGQSVSEVVRAFFLQDGELAYKLYGGCAAQASVCEERQRCRAEEVVDSRGNIKLLSDDDNLELFKEAVGLIQQEQVQKSTVEHIVAVPVPRLRPRSVTTRMKAMTSRTRVTRMIKKPVINVKLKRSGRDKERRKNRRKLKSKWKNKLFHNQHGDGSQGTEDDADHEARESHSPRRQKYRDKDEVTKPKIE